jgi:hypothetical protein
MQRGRTKENRTIHFPIFPNNRHHISRTLKENTPRAVRRSRSPPSINHFSLVFRSRKQFVSTNVFRTRDMEAMNTHASACSIYQNRYQRICAQHVNSTRLYIQVYASFILRSWNDTVLRTQYKWTGVLFTFRFFAGATELDPKDINALRFGSWRVLSLFAPTRTFI